MRILKLQKALVNKNPRPGFEIRSIVITVETDAGVQEQLFPNEIPPEGINCFFTEWAEIGVSVIFYPATDVMNDEEVVESEESSEDSIFSEEDDVDMEAEDTGKSQPKVNIYLAHIKKKRPIKRDFEFKVTPESLPKLRFEASEPECFLIYVYTEHREVDKSLYEEMEKKESLEAEDIFSKQDEKTCNEIIDRYLGPEKKSDKTAPVQILSSSSSSMSTIASDEPEYTLVELTDGTTILAEPFQHKGIPHRRPIQVRIPLRTILGKNKFDLTSQGIAAQPLSTLAGWENDKKVKLIIDQDYNEGGEFDKGHLMPSACGAPHNSYIIVPMRQFTNQCGGWKQMERKLARILYKINDNYKQSKPLFEEQELAAVMNGCFRAKVRDEERWNCYLRIIINYAETDDERVPTAFSVSLNRYKDFMTIDDFGGEIEHTDAEIDQETVSDELVEVFQFAENKLKELDKKYEDGEWDPERPWTDSPPGGFPECHLPRPYRALDVLCLKRLYDDVVEILEENEDDLELFNDVIKSTVGPGFGFSPAQRKLAILFNRWKNGGHFLSDLRKGQVKLHENYKHLQYLYEDEFSELKAWGGDNQAQADHHVPKSTASGTNYFTNLLYISRKQNLGSQTQNKPFWLTNPKFRGEISKSEISSESSKSKKTKETIFKTTVTRGIKSTTNMKREDVVKAFQERWRREEIVMDSLLISVAGIYWDAEFWKDDDPLPWTSDAESKKKEIQKFHFL